MMRIRSILIALGSLALLSTASAHDPRTHAADALGSAKNRLKGSCCSGNDYILAPWEQLSSGAFRVYVNGAWVDVPPDTYVDNVHNPYAEAVVWSFTDYKGKVTIRCFKEGVRA